MNGFVKPAAVAKHFNVSSATLRLWAEEKKIQYVQTPGGHRRYDITSFGKVDSTPTPVATTAQNQKAESTVDIRYGAIYCRVSSHKQKDGLQRQIQLCQRRYPNYKVYSDICSGLKYKRKGLPRLLEHVMQGLVKQVVVAHKDRLARFGTELIKWLLDQYRVDLVILDQDHMSPQQELTEDLMAIVHVFSCRLNGQRRYQDRRQGEEAKGKSLQKRRREDQEEAQRAVRRRVETTAT